MNLRNITELGHFVWDSGTAFLVRAASGDADEKSADYHDYIVTFGLDGERRDTVPINDDFHADKFGVFPSSGYFLIYGYDAEPILPAGIVQQQRNVAERFAPSQEPYEGLCYARAFGTKEMARGQGDARQIGDRNGTSTERTWDYCTCGVCTVLGHHDSRASQHGFSFGQD